MRIIKATVEKIEDFQKEDMKDALKFMGFEYLEMNFYRRIELDGDLVMYGELYDDAVLITVYYKNQEIGNEQFVVANRFIDYIESILNKYDISTGEIVDPDELLMADTGITVSAAKRVFSKSFQNRHDTSRRNKTTTKDFVSKLLRVGKSSNVWAFAFQPKDDTVGDMLVQFKSRQKGRPASPGDIYIYYNVPNKLWQRFYLADSKGGFFWRFIRNVFTYAKLTGDKRTHLPNGI